MNGAVISDIAIFAEVELCFKEDIYDSDDNVCIALHNYIKSL
jgi:hypothetical protein